MVNVRKNWQLRRCGFYNLSLAVVILILPWLLLQSHFYGFFALIIVVTVSIFNLLVTCAKFPSSWTLLSVFGKYDQMKRNASYEPGILGTLLLKFVMVLVSGMLVFYVMAVLFGAPAFDAYLATLYFSAVMTTLTVYPVYVYFLCCKEGLSQIQRIFIHSVHENIFENFLYTIIVFSSIGAWLGAIPIPLDWDRPWQEYPKTCCIGAILGYSAAHLKAGITFCWSFSKEKTKLPSDIFD